MSNHGRLGARERRGRAGVMHRAAAVGLAILVVGFAGHRIEAAERMGVTDRPIVGEAEARRITMRNALIEVTARVGPGGLIVERMARRLIDGGKATWTGRGAEGYRWRRLDEGGEGATLAGYTIIERADGGALLVAAMADDRGMVGTQWLALSRASTSVRLVHLRENRGRQAVPERWAWGVGGGEGKGDGERRVLVWPRGAGDGPTDGSTWLAEGDVKQAACLVHRFSAADEGELGRLDEQHGAGGGAAVARRAAIGAGASARWSVTMTAYAGVATPRAVGEGVALAAERTDEGWLLAVAAAARLHQGALKARAGQRRYRQTLNADAERPLVTAAPLDVDRLAVEVHDAGGRALLSGTLPQRLGEGVAPLARLDAVDDEAAAGEEEAGVARRAAIEGVLEAIRRGAMDEAAERLSAIEERSGLVGLLGLISAGEADDGPSDENDDRIGATGAAARRLLSDDPGLIEGWRAIGDGHRVAQLTRWSATRRALATETMRRLGAGHWPVGTAARRR